ncbi:carbon-nitrogen hydrolase family protein [Sulfobacillus harzensis]|uniref:Carbon-nitrogen hydrolase family protein n=1 Tax=Sulfobacillus harzensis TaxID=2729629 RepID=A0A7Y0L744_9FIRM|nr:carbon-nitrogen hydrolase family protein [Sulfobacillus harzensis]NMP23139.1 carbon-nitrogen hydrolase family protein [Sulfobacillus harzensis]
MKVSVVSASFPMTFDVAENLQRMKALVAQCHAHEVVVFPEGALSGYSDDIGFLNDIDQAQVDRGLDVLQELAVASRCHLFVGAIRQDGQGWRNQAFYLSPGGERWTYNKMNLATHERGYFVPGDELPVFTLSLPSSTLAVGVQLCRELRFPGQWRRLAQQGAELFIYMTHAINDELHRPVWRSHLISRAAENQRWVVATNVAHSAQLCPSMIVDPAGLVMKEAVSDAAGILRAEVDMDAVSNWYLNQIVVN